MMHKEGMDAFRAKQRQEAIERHETQKQLNTEQAEREAEAAAAAKLPEHEEMKNLLDKTKADMWQLQSGDVYATAKLRRAVIDALTVIQYIMRVSEAEPKQQSSIETGDI